MVTSHNMCNALIIATFFLRHKIYIIYYLSTVKYACHFIIVLLPVCISWA